MLINLGNPSCAKRFGEVVRAAIVGPIVSTLFSEEVLPPPGTVDYNKGMLHELVLYKAVAYGHQTTIQMGLTYLRSGQSAPPDFRKAVYR